MAQIKKDTSLRKAILQAAITGQLISDIGRESDVLFSNEKKSKTKLDSEADLPLASRVSKRNSVVSDSERTTPSPRGYAPKTPNEFASFENQNSVSERSERPTLPETGKQLLDRIIEERNNKLLADWEEALKKNVGGKATLPSFASKTRAKKPAPVVASEIDEDEIPFEIPENWCWCRLGDLGDFVRGSGIKRDETRSEGFPCIRYGEMYTRYKTVINETVSFVDKNVFDKCQKIIKNDIAMALTGENEYDIALAAVYTGDKEIAMGGAMTRFRPAFVNSLFLVFALNSPYGIECKSELATGNIIVHISNDKLGSIMIPLPPLEEQEEIVKKVEELLPLCK